MRNDPLTALLDLDDAAHAQPHHLPTHVIGSLVFLGALAAADLGWIAWGQALGAIALAGLAQAIAHMLDPRPPFTPAERDGSLYAWLASAPRAEIFARYAAQPALGWVLEVVRMPLTLLGFARRLARAVPPVRTPFPSAAARRRARSRVENTVATVRMEPIAG